MSIRTPLAAVLAVSLAGASQAATISFAGSFTFADLDSNGFRETINFTGPLGDSGLIFNSSPGDLAFTSPFSYFNVVIADLTLSQNDNGDDGTFTFAPTTYTDGFKIVSNSGDELLVADLAVELLVVGGSTGNINSAFELNLFSITAGADYVDGSSAAIDEFLNANIDAGALNLTLQADGDLTPEIVDTVAGSSSDSSTYSGSAEANPAGVPIPAPATAVAGSVLLGGLIARRRR